MLRTLNIVTVRNLRKTLFAGESSVSGSGGNHNVVSYHYRDKKADSRKVPKFNNGDPEEFSWWKTNFYNYVMGLNEELWDILEDEVGDLDLDEDGAVVDRKKHTHAQKKMYKKHHMIRSNIAFLQYL